MPRKQRKIKQHWKLFAERNYNKMSEFPWMGVEWESCLRFSLYIFPFPACFCAKEMQKMPVSRGNFPQLGHLQRARETWMHYSSAECEKWNRFMHLHCSSERAHPDFTAATWSPVKFCRTGRSQLVMFVFVQCSFRFMHHSCGALII